MRPCCHVTVARRRRGTTLVELMVAMAVTGVLMTAVYAVLMYGLMYYRTSTSTLDLQRSCLVALTLMSSEMAEGSKSSFATFDETTAHPGVIFGSPRGPGGVVGFEGRQLKWMKYVCYYRAQRDGVPVLIRKEKVINPPLLEPPLIPAGLTPASFETDQNLATRIVARQITSFEVTRTNPFLLEMTAADAKADFMVKISTSLIMQN